MSTKHDFVRTPDGSQRIIDYNLYAGNYFKLPIFTGAATLNGNVDEEGAIGYLSGVGPSYYDGITWQQFASTYSNGTGINLTANVFSLNTTYTNGLYVQLAGSYANPAWITSLPFSKLTGTPTTRSGYGITDAEPTITAGLNTQVWLGDKTWLTAFDGSGKIVSTLLPSYVDDILEYANLAALPTTGETGKIYVTLDTNFEYRWSGSVYIRLVSSPGSTDALAEGSINLYYTDARVQTFADTRYYKSGDNVSLGSILASSMITSTMGANSQVFSASGGGTGSLYGQIGNSGGSIKWGVTTSVGGGLASGASAYSAIVGNANASPLGLITNNIVRYEIDASGNHNFKSGAAIFGNTVTATIFTGPGTGLTGTAAGLTAGNVTTNANLTGPITSVGNATSIASQTGTGSKFVMDTSPTLVTPTLGVASATSLNITGTATTPISGIILGQGVTGTRLDIAMPSGFQARFNFSALTATRTYVTPDISGTLAFLNAGQTFTSAIWNATVIGEIYGGAGAINGIMKANGSGTVSAAVSNTDYLPITSPVMVTPTLGVASATSLNITGTGGNGFVFLPKQSGTSTPITGGILYAPNFENQFAFNGQNGFSAIFSTANQTAARILSTPDASGTIALTATTPQIVGTYFLAGKTNIGTLISYTPLVDGHFMLQGEFFVNSITTNTLRIRAEWTIPSGTAVSVPGTLVSSASSAATQGTAIQSFIIAKAGVPINVFMDNPTSGGSNNYDIAVKLTYYP